MAVTTDTTGTSVPLRMDPVIRGRWCRALESGEYTQADGQLRSNGRFCCLGVLTDLYLREHGLHWNDDRHAELTRGTRSYLPPQVCDWAGLGNCNPRLTPDVSATTANDTFRWTFPQIAQAIRTGWTPAGAVGRA